MTDLPLYRLYILRAMYLFIVVGLGCVLWPDICAPDKHWGLAQGEANCMLAAFSLICALGIRYPVAMLPILLWEVTWKTLWLFLVPLPQWRAGHVDAALAPTVFAVSLVWLVYLAVPWRYVVRQYAQAAVARWR